MSDYLCYYQLHVVDKSYYIHCIVEADSCVEALDRMPSSVYTNSYTLQKKGCRGIFNIEEHRKYLKEIGGGIKIE